MPMNAFPPGSFPGVPPSQPGGWGPPGTPPPGWGTPPPMGYPQQPQMMAPPPPKSRTGLYVGLGCGCLLLFACVGAAAAYFVLQAAKPGEEVASTPVTFNQPFTVSYVQQGSQKYAAWLEVDVSYTSGYRITGTVLLSENNAPFGQYTLDEDGEGCPVEERDDTTRWEWSSENLDGSGSAGGTVLLFPIPARAAGGTVTISGTFTGQSGMSGTIRVIVAKRE